MVKLSPAQRKQLSEYYKSGHSIEQCSNKYNVGWGVAKRWIDEGQKKRPSWTDRRRSGRPSKLDRAEKRRVVKHARKHKSAPKIAAVINKTRSDPVNSCTVYRHLKLGRHGVGFHPTAAKNGLRKQNAQKRLAFIRRNRRTDFSKCAFLDGKTFYLKKGNQKLGSRAWQDSKDRACKQTANCSEKNAIHVYAAVSKCGRSQLIRVPNVTGSDPSKRFRSEHACVALLELKEWAQNHFGGETFHLIMDNAKQHTSVDTKAFIQTNNIPIWDRFPPQSPDLNIIENVCKMLENRLMERRPQTLDGFWKIAQEEWGNIDQQYIANCVDAIPKRMQLIEKQGGRWLFQQSTK